MQTNGARGELGLPLPCCRAEGIRWLSGGWDKWVSCRHAHERFDMKPGEPGLAAGCTRHSAASSRGRPPCGAADDLAGPSHERGSAVATEGPSGRLTTHFRGGSRKEERHHRCGRQGRCNLAACSSEIMTGMVWAQSKLQARALLLRWWMRLQSLR